MYNTRKYLLLHAFIISSVFLISLIVQAEEEKVLAYTDSVTGMEFVLVKGACFHMGDNLRDVDNDGVGDVDKDEMPVHEACVDDFYIGRHEVTQGQWEEVMGSNPSNSMNGNNYPVERVSWNDVQDFIGKLNNKTGRNYRLPTDAEWEYAARSGEKKETWAGTSDKSELRRYAWYSSNNSRGQTHPVGQKEPNGLGLYDMTGNVWEWCPVGMMKIIMKIAPVSIQKVHPAVPAMFIGEVAGSTNRGTCEHLIVMATYPATRAAI